MPPRRLPPRPLPSRPSNAYGYGRQHYAVRNLQNQQNPYVVYSPAQVSDYPFKPVVSMAKTAIGFTRNVWRHLNTGQSVLWAALGKVNLLARAYKTERGYEAIFRQEVSVDPNEELKTWFSCHFSTTMGPVAGTLYLSTARVAFCSDSSVSFKADSGQKTRSYIKVIVPLEIIESVSPVVTENPPMECIHITTVDHREFWFMGFFKYDEASQHLPDGVSDFRARGSSAAAPPQPHTTT